MPHDPQHDPYYAANLLNWSERVAIHEASRDYDREGFLRGEKPLAPVELAELAPLVAGRTLLHLQCHFGMDTLNLARLGATVTGVDFSHEAIEAARRLSADSGLSGRFVEANIYDAPDVLDERFDVVYTGIGALNWLPDVAAWARLAAGFLRPGGRLYIYEGHPVQAALDWQRDDGLLVVAHPYFETREPVVSDEPTTYTDGPPLQHTRNYEWNHGIAEVVTAILDAGLQLDFLHEHQEAAWQALPWFEAVPGSRLTWRVPDRRDRLPMMYSLLATKP